MRWLRDKQGPVVGAALATLSAWLYSGWREGMWLPEATTEVVAAWTAFTVAITVTYLTERSDARSDPPGDRPREPNGSPPESGPNPAPDANPR